MWFHPIILIGGRAIILIRRNNGRKIPCHWSLKTKAVVGLIHVWFEISYEPREQASLFPADQRQSWGCENAIRHRARQLAKARSSRGYQKGVKDTAMRDCRFGWRHCCSKARDELRRRAAAKICFGVGPTVFLIRCYSWHRFDTFAYYGRWARHDWKSTSVITVLCKKGTARGWPFV